VRERLAAIFPLVLAVGVPLAGLLLALQAVVTGDRDLGLRIGLATVLGVCLWAALLTA
jgi:hypothetical protein